MSDLQQNEHLVAFGTTDHVLADQFQERLDLKELDDGVVVEDLCTGYLDRVAVETPQHVGKVVLLRKE